MNSKDKLRLRQLALDSKRLTVAIFSIVAFIIVFVWLFFVKKDNSLGLEVSRDINVTPEQIQSIRDIGEWEFLSISNEELVDTVRKGFLSNDELVRIYYGTLRLGVNLHQASPRWLQASGDSVTVTLPRIGLLDRDFIDEARTKSFYETGRWSPADREKLYHKAYRQMVAHSLTKENMETARQNAEEQFRQMMKAMGFRYIDIKFEEE
ncbi:MAG: DUF4230 domain-containing protein [Prevotella sp.]|jgi:hypothetical protein|nr:DUF4230 domain-containing protein [Prevotella sp.]